MNKGIWDHEHKHVRVDREIINKYRPQFELELKKILAVDPVVGPVANDQAAAGQQILQDRVAAAVARVTKIMQAERNTRQQAVDTRQEYDRVSNLCR
jgi:hypothetical protein